MLRAALFDIDGTLCPPGYHGLPPVTIQALNRLREAGFKLGIVTGRNLKETELLEDAFDFDGLSVNNGAVNYIGRSAERTLASTYPMPREGINRVAELVAEDKLATLVEYADRSVLAGSDERCDGLLEATVGQDAYKRERYVDADADVFKLAFVLPNVSTELLDSIPALTRVQNDTTFCDTVGEGAGKHVGVAALAEAWGLDPSEVIVFGDGGNDLTMLKAAGVGVAMGGCVEPAHEAADISVEGYYGDGILEACQKLGLAV